MGRGDQPRAAHAGHRDQGVRGHAHQPLGLARRGRPPGSGPDHRRPGRRAGPPGRPAALGDQRGRRGRRLTGRPVRPGRGAAQRGRGAARRPAPPAGAGPAARPSCPRRTATGTRSPPSSPSWPPTPTSTRPPDTDVELCAAADEQTVTLPGRRPRRRRPAGARRAGLRALLAGRVRRPPPPPRRRPGPLPGAPDRRAAARLGVAAPARGRRDGRRGAAPARLTTFTSDTVGPGCPVRCDALSLFRREQASEAAPQTAPKREKVRDIFVARPFEGLADEPEWIALRELVPAASAPLTTQARDHRGVRRPPGHPVHRAADGLARDDPPGRPGVHRPPAARPVRRRVPRPGGGDPQRAAHRARRHGLGAGAARRGPAPAGHPGGRPARDHHARRLRVLAGRRPGRGRRT